MPKPIISDGGAGIGNLNKPEISYLPTGEGWTFSFQYFHQTKYFGLEHANSDYSSWVVSLLNRLKDFNHLNIDHFYTDKVAKDAWRFHEINWNSRNIPLQKKDLGLPTDITNNDEIVFYQFQISTARGRIIGFSYENIFYVVLLDPLHNMQPARRFNYRVDDCYPLSSHYDSLCNDIDDLKRKKCSDPNCTILSGIKLLPKKITETNALVCYLDDSTLQALDQILEDSPLSDIIELGILAYNTK